MAGKQTMKLPKAIFFDFDGTLFDTYGITLRGANKALKELGYAQLADTNALRELSASQAIRSVGVHWWHLPKLQKLAIAAMRDELQQARPFKGIRAALEVLGEHTTIMVLTSNGTEPVEQLLRREKFQVDGVRAGVSIFGKAAAIRKLIRELGLSAADVVYVGDEVRDVEACRKAGIRVISVTWGFNTEKALKAAKPDAIVKTPAELVKRLSSTSA